MIASEPLPHFVDDLLGYLHETHPTHATLDGVHTHDDLLEDVSRHGIDSEAHALAGYLRRLDEINRDALTAIERLEHRMLTAHLQARMFELEDVRTWETQPAVLLRPARVEPRRPGAVHPRAGRRARAPRAVEAAPDAAADSGGARQHQGSARHLRQGRHRDDARRR